MDFSGFQSTSEQVFAFTGDDASGGAPPGDPSEDSGVSVLRPMVRPMLRPILRALVQRGRRGSR